MKVCFNVALTLINDSIIDFVHKDYNVTFVTFLDSGTFCWKDYMLLSLKMLLDFIVGDNLGSEGKSLVR